MLYKPKKKGGLGILNLKLQNEALLLKYPHKFYNKLDTPWVHLLWNTYYQGKIPRAMDPVGSFWLKCICKLMPILRGFVSSTIKDFSTNMFWIDAWLDEINAGNFPRAYSFVINVSQSRKSSLPGGSLTIYFTISLVSDSDTWTYPWGNNYTSRQYY
jgi:hypothetical protein